MKLSCIIPVFNEAPYLRRCLDSVPVQSDVEVIVIDDGSTDGSAEICDEYKNVFKVIHQPNGGVSKARNAGIDVAQGEYITFLDSDDEYIKNVFNIMFSDVGYARGENIIQFNHKRYYRKTRRLVLKYVNNQGYYTYDNRPLSWYGVWNKMFKREFVGKTRFKVGMQFGEDELFCIKLLFKNKYLWHSDRATLIRHFENQDSLVHKLDTAGIKAQDDVLNEYAESLKEQPLLYAEIQKLIANHRSSKLYKEKGWR